MFSVRFEPAISAIMQLQTYALERTVIDIS